MPRRGTGTGRAVQLGAGADPQKAKFGDCMGSGGPKPPPGVSPALLALSERAFQAHVVGSLKARGYLVWTIPDMRKTLAGLPDIIAVHPTRVPRRVHFWELKRVTGKVRPEQEIALAALGDIYGVDARVIRPTNWAATLEDL